MNTLVCQDELRREAVRHTHLNGIDYVEVSDDQYVLTVYFLGKAPENIAKENVRITGGQRVTNIQVTRIDVCRMEDQGRDDCMQVHVYPRGDFSTYTLCLVDLDEAGKPIVEKDQAEQPKVDKQGRPRYRAMTGFDVRYACIEFSFKAGCPSDLDCQQRPVCPPEKRDEPEIDYLAKDYASFRQLILDRLALIMPDWRERHVPDLGIALVEILAYVGDHLSYYQDAVATEAYLDTARQRLSVRRHARLVDYLLHEGCNARTWVTFWVSQDLPLMPDDFYLITHPGATTSGTILDHDELPKTLPRPYLVFEPLIENRAAKITFYQAHNEIRIYTWGDVRCCLRRGATSATLIDPGTAPATEPTREQPCEGPELQAQAATKHKRRKKKAAAPPPESGPQLRLQPCDVVIFEEVKGPRTGNRADADPHHRHAVRLTQVTRSKDPLNGRLVVEIEWAEEDALPFPLCVSSVREEDCTAIPDVSVVRGNVLLVDQGERFEDGLGQVPVEILLPECGDACVPREALKVAGWYRPKLSRPEVTFSQPLPPCVPISEACASTSTKLKPASAVLNQEVRQALPQVTLYGFPAAGDGAAAFGPEDLVNPDNIARALLDESKPKTRYLRNQFSADTLELLKAYDPASSVSPELRQALIEELTALRETWEPRQDLLGSWPEDRHFVAEVDNGRIAHLRFGDGELGRIPDAGATFQAVYRVGNGPVGNVGAEAVSHIVFRNKLPRGSMEIRSRNPLPAVGGTAPEPLTEAKLFAPHAFRKELQRAITADDYANIVMRDFKHRVQRAKAVLRWTGGWYEVMVAVDALGSVEAKEELLCEILGHLHRCRRIGHDVVVKPARTVALDIAMTVCVLPDYLRGHVKKALLDLFSNRTLPDGRLGFFHPDNLSFGDGIYLSKLVAAAQSVTGVESVVVTKQERFSEGPNQEIENGKLPLGPLEIARLDNDPSFPENGQFKLEMRGGR